MTTISPACDHGTPQSHDGFWTRGTCFLCEPDSLQEELDAAATNRDRFELLAQAFEQRFSAGEAQDEDAAALDLCPRPLMGETATFAVSRWFYWLGRFDVASDLDADETLDNAAVRTAVAWALAFRSLSAELPGVDADAVVRLLKDYAEVIGL